MKRLVLVLSLVSALVGGAFFGSSAQGATSEQRHGFGTIAKGSTLCVGPLAPTEGGGGVLLSGFTNGSGDLTWQLLTDSGGSGDNRVVIFETTARSVDHVDTTTADLFDACVLKTTGGSAQDFNITLNSTAISP